MRPAIFVRVLVFLSSLLLAGCGGGPATSDEATEPTSSSVAPTNGSSGADSASGSAAEVETTVNASTNMVAGKEKTETEGELPWLEVGSPAPSLTDPEWAMGKEVGDFETGKIYVVEFWATWCPPCRDSMPHLSKLQEEYGDAVTFIGVSDEDRATVDDFFEKNHDDDQTWAEVIKYSIALDPTGDISKDYMRAARQNGIPAAFVVGGDGVIEWIGHPMGIDKPLAAIADGTWDRAAELERQAAKKRFQAAAMKLQEAQQAGDTNGALAIIDDLMGEAPEGAQTQLSMAKVSILLEDNQAEEAGKVLTKLAEDNWENSDLLNGLAWSMATEMPDVNLDDALKFATRANELTDGEDGSVIDTVARVYFEKGEVESAVEWQKKAVAISSEFQSGLDEYESKLEDGDEEDDESSDDE